MSTTGVSGMATRAFEYALNHLPGSWRTAIQDNSYVAGAAATAATIGVTSWLYLLRYPLPLSLAKQKRSLGYFAHPSELLSIANFLLLKPLPSIPDNLDQAQDFCYKSLVKTSRSFAAVILELHEELREAVAIFYLTLRGLDTIEDDMKPSVEAKVKELNVFYKHLSEPGWNIKGYGDKKDEIDLLENFDKVIDVCMRLKPGYQRVIADITKQMGEGMAKYLSKKVVTIADYEEYCFYVAGLVGYGLSGLFGESGLEDPVFKEKSMDPLSNSMGLFLQKTNIIRDYLEDVSDSPPRLFWPKEIWGNYAEKVEDLKAWDNRAKALACLNHMITDAIKHAIDCLNYLKLLKDPTVFKFCAIPQVMAISTLELCYNNHDVFRYEVKIRKGNAVQLILGSKDYKSVCGYFLEYCNKLEAKIPSGDPNASKLRASLATIKERCRADLA